MAATVMSRSEKDGVSHLEPANVDETTPKVDGYDSYGLVKSTFDELSIPQTLWAFKRVILISLAVYTGYVCEGFEVSSDHPLATPREVEERGLMQQITARRGRQCHRQRRVHQAVW